MQTRAGGRIARVGLDCPSKDLISLLGKPPVPVTRINVGVDSSGGSRFWRKLRVVGRAILVRKGVDEEIDIAGLGFRDLEAGEGRFQRSYQLALGC